VADGLKKHIVDIEILADQILSLSQKSKESPSSRACEGSPPQVGEPSQTPNDAGDGILVTKKEDQTEGLNVTREDPDVDPVTLTPAMP